MTKSYVKKLKISLLAVSSILCLNSAHSGVVALTIHSRANCVNNESISWQLGVAHKLRTVSVHYDKDTDELMHTIAADYEMTWRSAAVHWNESMVGSDKWYVNGYHFIMDDHYRIDSLGSESVDDCSIYDGWWN